MKREAYTAYFVSMNIYAIIAGLAAPSFPRYFVTIYAAIMSLWSVGRFLGGLMGEVLTKRERGDSCMSNGAPRGLIVSEEPTWNELWRLFVNLCKHFCSDYRKFREAKSKGTL